MRKSLVLNCLLLIIVASSTTAANNAAQAADWQLHGGDQKFEHVFRYKGGEAKLVTWIALDTRPDGFRLRTYGYVRAYGHKILRWDHGDPKGITLGTIRAGQRSGSVSYRYPNTPGGVLFGINWRIDDRFRATAHATWEGQSVTLGSFSSEVAQHVNTRTGPQVGKIGALNNYGGEVQLVLYHPQALQRPFGQWSFRPQERSYLNYNGSQIVIGGDWQVLAVLGNGVRSPRRHVGSVSDYRDGMWHIVATRIFEGR